MNPKSLAANVSTVSSNVVTVLSVPDGASFVRHDVRDDGLAATLAAHGITCVVHLASIVTPGRGSTRAFEYGVDWQRLITHAFRQQLKESVNVESTFPIDSTLTSLGKLTFTNIAANSVDLVIGMLKTIGETKLISSPRISALNNEEAKIFVGTKVAPV